MRRDLVCLCLLGLVASGCQQDNKPMGGSPKETRPSASSFLDLVDQPSATDNPSNSNQPPRFAERATELGIDFAFYSDTVPGRYYLPEVMGGGVGWIDFDLDGLMDLYFTNGAALDPETSPQTHQTNRLYHNRGDRFEALPEGFGAEDTGYGQGVAIGDFNADGFPDVFVANFGENHLYQNQGDGSFRDISLPAGIQGSVWSSSCLFADIDHDRDLDLYVVNYMDVRKENYKICQYNGIPGYCGPGQYSAVQDEIYLNQGDGTFIESAEALGLVAEDGKGLAITSLDFDQDLQAEIYVANDMTPNFLFSVDPEATSDTTAAAEGPMVRYRELGLFSGTAASDEGQPEASMGIAASDFDRDGLPDLFLTHFYSHKNTLYRNRGKLVFTDESKTTNIARTSYETLGFGTVNLDYDLDGATDLFVANGHVLGPEHPPYQMHPQLLHNDGSGSFTDVTAEAGSYFQGLYLGRGAAGGDLDNDGDSDLVVNHIGAPVAVLENQTPSDHNFLGLDLSHPDRALVVGSRVLVSYGDQVDTYYVSSGGSYLSSPDHRLIIGLGTHSGPVDVSIHWTTGEVDELTGLAVGRYWQVWPGEPPRDLSALPE